MSQHTVGDWVWNTYQTFEDGKEGERGYYVQQKAGRLIARFPMINGDCTSGEQRANSQLFLAAPKLLEALRLYVRLDNDRHAGCKISAKDWAQCHQAAMSALAQIDE